MGAGSDFTDNLNWWKKFFFGEILLDSAQYFIVLHEIIAITRREDPLLIQIYSLLNYYLYYLLFVSCTGIKPENSKY